MPLRVTLAPYIVITVSIVAFLWIWFRVPNQIKRWENPKQK